MNFDMQLPSWAWWLMGLGLAFFALLVGISVKRNRGVKRSLFAAPYTLWMILFTVLPVILIKLLGLMGAVVSYLAIMALLLVLLIIEYRRIRQRIERDRNPYGA